jgi:hypothetical protein
MKFYQLAIGARFTFRRLEFEKSARGFAKGIGDGPNDHRYGAAFMPETEVESDGPFLTEAEIGLWRPSVRPWYEYLSPAPPPRGGPVK